MVERTIREIREAQAERERTKELRQEMDDFRRRLEEESQHEHDEMIEKKMRKIEERRKRKEERRSNKERLSAQNASTTPADSQTGGTAKPTKAESDVFTKGQSVRIKGQTSVGEVIEIQGKQAVVAFGMMRTVVDISRLVPAKKQEEAQHVTVSYLSRSTQDQMRQRNLNFKQEIDIRGMRGEEALQAITYYIDDAILVGASRVRILHGTGNGILRQLIRQYLSTVPAVRSAHDEHVQLGGAGITVVELS